MNWYPRYFGDYTKSTAHLSLAEHGAYTVILDHYYGIGSPLINDLSAICRICRAFDDVERRAVESVCEQFFPVAADGKRHNKRADEEIAKANAIGQKRAASGAQGARSRWGKQTDGKCHESAIGKRMAIDTTTTTTTTGTSTARVKSTKKDKSPAEIPPDLKAVEGFAEIWPQWIDFRKSIKKPATEYAQKLMLKTLAKYPEHSVAAIEKCIMRGWIGLEWPWFFKDTVEGDRKARNAKASGYYDSGEDDTWQDDYTTKG